jgi:hypothetical protein
LRVAGFMFQGLSPSPVRRVGNILSARIDKHASKRFRRTCCLRLEGNAVVAVMVVVVSGA